MFNPLLPTTRMLECQTDVRRYVQSRRNRCGQPDGPPGSNERETVFLISLRTSEKGNLPAFTPSLPFLVLVCSSVGTAVVVGDGHLVSTSHPDVGLSLLLLLLLLLYDIKRAWVMTATNVKPEAREVCRTSWTRVLLPKAVLSHCHHGVRSNITSPQTCLEGWKNDHLFCPRSKQ